METTNTSLGVSDIRPFIGAKDFNASRDFYVALGWRVTYESDDLRVLDLADHRFYLQKYYNKEWCNNTMLHVSVHDVCEWHLKEKSRAATVADREMAGPERISRAITLLSPAIVAFCIGTQ